MGCWMILQRSRLTLQLFLVTTSSIVFQVKDFSARNGHLEACRNDNLCPICPRPQEGLFNDEPPPAIIIIAHCWPLSAPRQIVPALPFQPYPGNGRYSDCSNWNIMKEDYSTIKRRSNYKNQVRSEVGPGNRDYHLVTNSGVSILCWTCWAHVNL